MLPILQSPSSIAVSPIGTSPISPNSARNGKTPRNENIILRKSKKSDSFVPESFCYEIPLTGSNYSNLIHYLTLGKAHVEYLYDYPGNPIRHLVLPLSGMGTNGRSGDRRGDRGVRGT